ncbi:MAG: potassium channel family protein, partial [Candidatus Marinimicrobia bacterium]|nr:potassium channel family protein [Candidatus Neomarinimicrobiota bacterium]
TIWQLVILVLSVLVLLLLLIETVFTLTPGTQQLIRLIDTSVCLIFIGDFFYQFFSAKNRLAFLKWGWIDLLSSIPLVDAFRVGRLVRIARIIRALRAVRAGGSVLNYLTRNRTKNTLLTVLGGTVVLIIVASLAVINVERLPAEDALWWSIYALLTGELGEYTPISIEGKIIAVLLMTAGVALFGTFTASVATFFFEPENSENEERDNQILKEIKKLSEKIDVLVAKLDSKS